MMRALILILIALSFSGCVTKQTTTNSQGVVTDEKYIIKRPVKKFINNVEFE